MVDRRELVRGVIWGMKPACEFSSQGPNGLIFSDHGQEALKLARRFNLEVIERELSSGWVNVIIGVPNAKARDILKNAKDSFNDLGVSRELGRVIKELGKCSIAQAVVKLLEKEHNKPEIVICWGLLFGFPVCCIRYFVETRCTVKQYEPRCGDVGYVQCDACYAANVIPPWLKPFGVARRAGKRAGYPPR